MLKKSLLTPILSGVLAVTVIGSGVFYVLNNKDTEKEEKKGGKTSISKMTSNISDTIEFADKAAKGELDFGYNANIEFTLGDSLTQSMGYNLKPFSMETVTKQKGKKTASDIKLKYDAKDIISFNSVLDNETGDTYIRVPELSDAYILGTADELQEMLGYSTYGSFGGSVTGMATSSASPDAILDVFKDIDYDALFADIEEYESILTENAPEPVDGEKIKGEISGHSYSFTTKSYEVTGEVAYNILTASVEKLKGDEIIKQIALDTGITEADYIASLDELVADAPTDDEKKEVLANVDVYYDGDVATGFLINSDDLGLDNYKVITVASDDVTAIDMDITIDESNSCKAVGAFETKKGKTNGSVDYDVNIEGAAATAKISLTDIEEQGDFFSGAVKYEIKMDQDGTTINPVIELVSNSASDKLDLSLNVSNSGENYFNLGITGEETDASDITIPTGDIYKMDDAGMESYMSKCDFNKVMDNLKSALGDELYNDLFGSDVSGSTGYDDFDFDDFDLDV